MACKAKCIYICHMSNNEEVEPLPYPIYVLLSQAERKQNVNRLELASYPHYQPLHMCPDSHDTGLRE